MRSERVEPTVVEENEAAPTVVVVGEPRAVISDEAWNRAVGTWIDRHLRSTPLSQASDAWNHLSLTLPRLREYLERELRG